MLDRLFSSLDEVYCMFVGSLSNLSSLTTQYGLCTKLANEAVLVIEAYRTLRDRGPYPADQVLKDLNGSFAFVVYDNKAGTVFAALVCFIVFVAHRFLSCLFMFVLLIEFWYRALMAESLCSGGLRPMAPL